MRPKFTPEQRDIMLAKLGLAAKVCILMAMEGLEDENPELQAAQSRVGGVLLDMVYLYGGPKAILAIGLDMGPRDAGHAALVEVGESLLFGGEVEHMSVSEALAERLADAAADTLFELGKSGEA
jgi:hypothetical protein